MSTAFTVEIDDREVRQALGRLRARLSDLTPLMQDIGRALGNLTEDAFQAEQSPWGVPWADLDPDYVARSRAQGGRGGDAHPILQVTGGLAASVTHGGDATSAWVGVSKRYGAIQQFGGTADMAPGPRAVVARPFLPVDAAGTLAPAAREEILDLARAYLATL